VTGQLPRFGMFDEIRWAVTHVLRSPARLRFLLGDGPQFPYDLVRFLRRVVPLAAAQLAKIEAAAETIPDELLRREALASARNKAYHVAGGCILATFLPGDAAGKYVEIIAPLESIYDYLDNLCDRHPDVRPDAYPVFHRALSDALDPTAQPSNYYAEGPFENGNSDRPVDDGGYLAALVRQVQQALRNVRDYDAVVPMFREAVKYYSEMQTFKHLAPDERESACVAWYERSVAQSNNPFLREITWYEFACAAGSQFHVYVPLYLLFTRSDEQILEGGYNAYFPAVAALHVLLDSFIDQAEDREHGELNFVDCYESFVAMETRVQFLVATASKRFEQLPVPYQHRFLLRVMALFYLTHPKVSAQNLDSQAIALLRCFEL